MRSGPLIAGKFFPLQIVGKIFLLPGIVAVFPIHLFADRHGLSVYVKIELFLLLTHSVLPPKV